jgi:mannose-6-phosphate isomerase
LWLGAHPGSPAHIVNPATASGARDLPEWIENNPEVALGGGRTRLPFLLKVLAAASPLSLQAHPTVEQARNGFARENALGIAVDAPDRNYRDEYPKPEIIFALSDRFEALCGFRPRGESLATIDRLIELDSASAQPEPATGPLHEWRARLDGGEGALRRTFEWLIGNQDPVPTLVSRVVELAGQVPDEFPGLGDLHDAYPGDPGVVISLLLHRVVLSRGQVLSLPAGNIHAYLNGLGIELMTASDNVLRGGLTSKHVDVAELTSVLDFTPVPPPLLPPANSADGVEIFSPGVDDFRLAHFFGSGEIVGSIALTGPAIVLCTTGEFSLTGDHESVRIQRGESIYITHDEGELRVTGTGEAFVATTA